MISKRQVMQFIFIHTLYFPQLRYLVTKSEIIGNFIFQR